jgi:hypothetical protein
VSPDEQVQAVNVLADELDVITERPSARGIGLAALVAGGGIALLTLGAVVEGARIIGGFPVPRWILLVLGATGVVGGLLWVRKALHVPHCRACNRTLTVVVAAFPRSATARVLTAVQRRDAEALAALPKARREDDHLALELAYCPKCTAAARLDLVWHAGPDRAPDLNRHILTGPFVADLAEVAESHGLD